MRNNSKCFNDIPHYYSLPFVIQNYIKYKSVIENRTFKTVRIYTYDISFFLKYMVCLKEECDTFDIAAVDISFLNKDFFKSITRSDILEYLFYLKTVRNNSTSSRYRKLEAIKSLFKYLHNEKIVEEDAAAEIDLPNLEQTLPKYLTAEESRTLLEHISSTDYDRDFCIIMIFLCCGLRLSELVNINITDIHGEILRVNGKGSKERDVVLAPICRYAISQYLLVRSNCEKAIINKNALFISRKTGKRIGERRVQQIVSAALKGAGFEGYSTHKLRHTAATLMYQNGADIRVLKDVLGHENLNTTEIYTHVSADQMKEAISKNPLTDFRPQKLSQDENKSA